mmetsp:Transcript_16541/g.47623  ORF Transcript_16541/g.47623 Transcript_16541/m.47623 type:complete len:84 (-) Transcript_16541:656-907(-)
MPPDSRRNSNKASPVTPDRGDGSLPPNICLSQAFQATKRASLRSKALLISALASGRKLSYLITDDKALRKNLGNGADLADDNF